MVTFTCLFSLLQFEIVPQSFLDFYCLDTFEAFSLIIIIIILFNLGLLDVSVLSYTTLSAISQM